MTKPPDHPPLWIDYQPLDDIQYTPGQPKHGRHDQEQIAASIDRQGYVDPIVVDERTGLLVSGEGRCEVLKAMRARGEDPPDRIEVGEGGWVVPVLRGYRSVSDADAKAYVLSANVLPGLGGWDEGLLLPWLEDVAASDAGLAGSGFGQDEVAGLLGGGAGESEVAADRVELVPVRWKWFLVRCDVEAVAVVGGLLDEVAEVDGVVVTDAVS